MKLHVRYPSRGEVPKGHEDQYSPIDETKPDGPQIWTGFEPDPDGYALVNASKLNADLARLQADKVRADATNARYRKGNSKELWTPEEIAALEQMRGEYEALRGKVPDADAIRRQTAAELTQQHAVALKALETRLQSEGEVTSWWRQEHEQMMRQQAARAALSALPRPKKGLENIPVDLLARDIELVGTPVDGDERRLRYSPRIKGPNGPRVNARGEPISPEEYAKSEFIRVYGEMFEATDQRNGTGARGSDGGNMPRQPQGSKGSGRFQLKQSDVLQDVGKLREGLKTVPKTDMLQIVDDAGQIVDARQGEA